MNFFSSFLYVALFSLYLIASKYSVVLLLNVELSKSEENINTETITILVVYSIINGKGHPPSAELRYREVNSISHSTLVLAALKGLLGI